MNRVEPECAHMASPRGYLSARLLVTCDHQVQRVTPWSTVSRSQVHVPGNRLCALKSGRKEVDRVTLGAWCVKFWGTPGLHRENRGVPCFCEQHPLPVLFHGGPSV